jgi:sialic acid synthase SpsE
MTYDKEISILERQISLDNPTYFIADIAASHDGELSRAKELIFRAKEAGAEAVKFQHFLAKDIVSDRGFKNLGSQLSHQANWSKPVYNIYEQYECPRDWTSELAETAKKVGIHFITTPYDVEAVEIVDHFVPAYKIGSGDITWPYFIEYVSKKNKPVIVACGASTMADVERAVAAALRHTRKFALLQCNTNYTGDSANFKYVNLNVLKTFSKKYPGMVLGLSDHTPGHAAVLGAIAFGARIIEKHFTDDRTRIGPDHAFSLDPKSWREMVDRSRELENAFGDGVKRIESNENQTVVVQRRCMRYKTDLKAGSVITADDMEALRPASSDGLAPYNWQMAIGKKLSADKIRGDAVNPKDWNL